MRKQNIKITSIRLSIFFLLLTTAVSQSLANNATFKTFRTMLMDPCGQPMVVRGVNAGIAFPSDPSASGLNEVSKTGANTVRLTFRWLINRSTPQSVATALQKAVENHMLAMPSIWDATGKWERLPFAVNFWTQPEMVSVLRQYEDMLLLNIANEAGANITQDQFRQGYLEAIQKIRQAGLHMPLVIDAANWGGDENYILQNARYLIRVDPDHKLVFSWHPWDENQPHERYKSAIDTANQQRIPLLIGEFSSVGALQQGQIDYRYMMQYAAEQNIGWLWWWWSSSSGQSPDRHALTSDGLYGNWVNVGEEIVTTSPYGIEETSIRTGYLENRTCGAVEASLPAAPSDLSAVATEGAEVTLAWKDNSNNERNFDIEVWDEVSQSWRLVKVVGANIRSAAIGAGSEFVYSMDSVRDPSLDYEKTYLIRVGAYVSRNLIAYSEPVTVTTNPNPSSCSNGDGLEADYYDARGGSWPGILKTDAQINFDWGMGSPDPSDPTAPTDHFEVAWYGDFEPQFDGEYTFYTDSDDFARVWIDGEVVIDNWQAFAKGWAVGKVRLSAGVKHSILVEYREWDGSANMSLYWASNKLKRELVPQCRLFTYSNN